MHALTVIENVTVTHCHGLTLQKVLRSSLVIGLLRAAAIMCLVVAKRATCTQWSELCFIGDTDGCLCVWFALLVVWLVVYAPGTPMCLRVGFIRG